MQNLRCDKGSSDPWCFDEARSHWQRGRRECDDARRGEAKPVASWILYGPEPRLKRAIKYISSTHAKGKGFFYGKLMDKTEKRPCWHSGTSETVIRPSYRHYASRVSKGSNPDNETASFISPSISRPWSRQSVDRTAAKLFARYLELISEYCKLCFRYILLSRESFHWNFWA